MIACIDGGLFCVGLPLLLACAFPASIPWLRRKFPNFNKWIVKRFACKKECCTKLDK